MTKNSLNPISFDDFSEGLLSGQNLAEQCGLSKTALDTCYTVSVGYYLSGSYDLAVAGFYFLCAHDHTNDKYWHGLSKALVAADRWSEAHSAFLVTLALNPENISACLGLARVYLKLGENNLAKECVDTVKSFLPNDESSEAKELKELHMAVLHGQQQS